MGNQQVSKVGNGHAFCVQCFTDFSHCFGVQVIEFVRGSLCINRSVNTLFYASSFFLKSKVKHSFAGVNTTTVKPTFGESSQHSPKISRYRTQKVFCCAFCETQKNQKENVKKDVFRSFAGGEQRTGYR